MLQRGSGRAEGTARKHAAVFAALGDETRLALVKRLCGGEALSIRELAANSTMTRQAVTKHLRRLERVGLVRAQRVGRESLFAYDPEAVAAGKEYLDGVSGAWDRALERLKGFVDG